LSIDPTSAHFSTNAEGGDTKTFTVTNHGPGSTGALVVTLEGADFDQFDIAEPSSDCLGAVLDEDETCAVEVDFTPGGRGLKQAELIVADPADGEAVATLSGEDDA
jgi:hypothetical protein